MIVLIGFSFWPSGGVKSAKISWSVPRSVTDEDEIRVTAAGSVSPYIASAAKVLNELNKPTIVIKGAGNSLSTVVTAAEILTRRFKGLRQVASLDSTKIVNRYEPPSKRGWTRSSKHTALLHRD